MHVIKAMTNFKPSKSTNEHVDLNKHASYLSVCHFWHNVQTMVVKILKW